MTKVREKKTSRENIYSTAITLFSEQGYTGTTMRDIAKEVGILPGSLYAHIKSKDELLSAIVENGIQKFLDIEVEINGMPLSAEVRLRAAVEAHVKVVTEDPEKMLIVFHQWRYLAGEKKERAIKLRRNYAKMYSEILKLGTKKKEFRSDIDFRVEVFSILGALNWVPEWYRKDGSYSYQVIAQKISDSFIFGLTKK